MENKRFDMMQIEPKAFCGKVNQAMKIADLDKRWTDMKYAFVKDGFKAHKRFLRKKNKNIETITKDLMQSKPQSLNILLRKDPEIYNLCKEKGADDLIETIEGLLFEKRKRLDKLNFKLNKLKEDYYLLQIDIRKAKEASKNVRGDKMIKACQDAEVDLQNLRTEKETALIVLNSYKKLLDVLHRDSQYFDTIILRYKAYILLRAEFAYYLLKMLKWAIYDAKTVEEATKVAGFLRWEVISKQTSEMEAIKSKISRIRSKVTKSPEEVTKEFDIFKAQQEQFQQYNMSLQYIRNKWDDYFEAIRDSCRVSKDTEILTSIENALQDKYYLLKQIEINNLLLDNYSRRKNYLQQTLETLMYTKPASATQTEKKIAELTKQKKKLEKEYKEVESEWYYMPKDLHSMYQTMFNLNHFLKLVASPPHNIYKLNREIFMKYDPKANKELDVVKKPVRRVDDECKVSNEQMPVVNDEHFIISQREREREYPVGYGEKYTPMEKFDYLEDEYRVPHVFDSIFLKVKLLLRQLGSHPDVIYKKPTKRQQRAFRKYIQSNGTFQYGPGIAIETEEEEDEGEREEKDELENLLLSMWSKGGKIGRR